MSEIENPLPDLKAIALDLKELIKHGIGAVPDYVELPTLVSFEATEEDAVGSGPLDRVLAVERFVERAVETFQGTPPHTVLQDLLGLTPSTSGALAKQRRSAAARKGGYDPATFNRHDEQRLLRLLARRVYELETDTRLRRARLGQPPSAKEIKATWAQRFTHYQRMAGILSQLRLDLIAVLLTYNGIQDDRGRDAYLDTSLWQYARFLVALERFSRELGGVFVMPEPSADIEAKSAIDLVIWHGPYNERGRSWLRTALIQAPGEELHPFASRVHDDPEANEMLGLWEQWLESCRCDPDVPEPRCRPHQVIEQCEGFSLVVEEQLNLVRGRGRSARKP